MAKETFVVVLEPEKGHICELFDRVRDELRKASKTTVKAYEYDEMRYGNQGCLLITLETSKDCWEILEDILKHARGIRRFDVSSFNGFFT